jgi:hypothetical protein
MKDYPIDIKKILYSECPPPYPYDCCIMTSGYGKSKSTEEEEEGKITMDSTIITMDNDIITLDNQ